MNYSQIIHIIGLRNVLTKRRNPPDCRRIPPICTLFIVHCTLELFGDFIVLGHVLGYLLHQFVHTHQLLQLFLVEVGIFFEFL